MLLRSVDFGNLDLRMASISSKVICLCLVSSGESVESGSWIESDIILSEVWNSTMNSEDGGVVRGRIEIASRRFKDW